MAEVLEFSARALPRRSARTRERTGVSLQDVVLEYPLGPFVKGSIKANLLRLVGYRETTAVAETVRALNGVSLRIEHGERVALIGGNGSGKSTTLRAIAGIYPLHAGRITVEGEIGALLDVGLGFETESTGRENIYHRGMAMGLSPKLLKEYEQEIIDFSALGDFIDLPMRTYSAGMYVRLGFAISTQFAPDVLLIDEVFGAGDASFAARAVRRMESIVANSGLLVLVTHDMNLVRRVCDRAIWLRRGQVMLDGPTNPVINAYLSATTS